MAPIYVYAIVEFEGEAVLDEPGLGDDGVTDDGVTDDGVRIVSGDGGLGAVVSDSPLDDYRGLDRQQAATYLVNHQRVVEAVMKEMTVLPVRFGTVMFDEDAVRGLLEQGGARFAAALDEFRSETQMEVVVLWDLQKIFGEIGREQEILRLKDEIEAKPADETMPERVAVGQLVQASLLRRRVALQERLLPAMQNVARDIVVNPPMDDSMVLNAALLVAKDAAEELDDTLDRLDEELHGRLYFRRVGPLPPYSFANVAVEMPSFADVDAARETLGLPVDVTPGEIRQAYRRLAAATHPDHSPDDPQAEERMAELSQAHKLLSGLAEAQEGHGSGDGRVRLDRDTVEGTLLISIQRQETAG